MHRNKSLCVCGCVFDDVCVWVCLMMYCSHLSDSLPLLLCFYVTRYQPQWNDWRTLKFNKICILFCILIKIWWMCLILTQTSFLANCGPTVGCSTLSYLCSRGTDDKMCWWCWCVVGYVLLTGSERTCCRTDGLHVVVPLSADGNTDGIRQEMICLVLLLSNLWIIHNIDGLNM